MHIFVFWCIFFYFEPDFDTTCCLLTKQLAACESKKKSLEKKTESERELKACKKVTDKRTKVFGIFVGKIMWSYFSFDLQYLKQTYILKIAEVTN